jgi:glycine/D-amino acid oxidase-like deaminating enzyme
MTADAWDCVVVGAGATGLWATRDLARHGVEVALIHLPDPSGYASTRNQGWMHSGALYTVFGTPDLAAANRAGARRIVDHVKAQGLDGCVGDDDFLYVFDDADAAGRAVSGCRAAGLDVHLVSDARPVDELTGGPSHVVVVPDQTVNTTLLLRSLADWVCRAGVTTLTARAPTDVGLRREGGAWTIRTGGEVLRAARVVLATGPAAPSMVAANVPTADVSAYRLTSTTVLSVAGVELPGAVVPIPRGPHVIPHRTAAGRPGFTVCVPFDNQPSTPDAIHRPPAAERRRAVLSAIDAALPGLAEVVASAPADDVHWYSCQKLGSAPQPDRPGWRHNTVDEVADGLWLAYSGKFTTAPLIGDDILRRVWLEPHPTEERRAPQDGSAVPVAARPYDRLG